MNTSPIVRSTCSKMRAGVQAAKETHLDRRADQRRNDEGERQAQQEWHAIAVAEHDGQVSAGHRERAVREIGEVHQSQRHREAGREHEQQHAVGDAVEEYGQHDGGIACPSRSLRAPSMARRRA